MTCRMPGTPCPNEATKVVRVLGLGLRDLCDDCIAILDRLGAHHTIQAGSEPASPQPVPLPAASLGPLGRRLAAMAPPADRRPTWLRNATFRRDLNGGLR